MFTYRDSILLGREVTLENAEIIKDKVTEIGTVVTRPRFLRRIDFSVEAESEWELRDMLADLELEVQAFGGKIEVDRTKVTAE